MIKRILCALAAVTLISCAAQGPYELSLRLPPGRVTRYLMTTEQTVRQVLPGQTITVAQKSTTEFSLESRSSTGDLLFDSRSTKRSTPALRGMQSLIGQGFRILVDRRGRIRDIRGLEQMLEKIRSSAAAGADPAFTATLERYLNPGALVASLAGFFEFIPDRKVLPGDSWQTERPGAPGLAQRLRNTWKLREVRGGRAVLDLATAILSEGPPANGGLGGTQEGSVELELSTGALLSASTRQQLRGTVVVRGLPVPMEITGSAAIRGTVQGSK
jgi:hypothetical protein